MYTKCITNLILDLALQYFTLKLHIHISWPQYKQGKLAIYKGTGVTDSSMYSSIGKISRCDGNVVCL
jgi:hypothetical protein